jgi:hypothetical protein
MSRSERYISPSPEQLERWRQAQEAAKRCDREREALLRAALKKTRKADVVELVLQMARQEKASQWLLEQEMGLDKPVHLLVNDIEVAMEIATRVDEARLNYNFNFDRRAYDAVRRGLLQLLQKDGLEEAKTLALKLMDKGCYQIDCSDEGLMQEDIEDCLRPVIAAVAGSPGAGKWARRMLGPDGRCFLCRPELIELAGAGPTE